MWALLPGRRPAAPSARGALRPGPSPSAAQLPCTALPDSWPDPSPPRPCSDNQAATGEVKYTAVGRRKTATAKVYLVPGAWTARATARPLAGCGWSGPGHLL